MCWDGGSGDPSQAENAGILLPALDTWIKLPIRFPWIWEPWIRRGATVGDNGDLGCPQLVTLHPKYPEEKQPPWDSIHSPQIIFPAL